MKKFCMFLALSCSVYGGSIEVQEVYDKAREMVRECSDDEDEDEILFAVYSQAIDQADEKTLQENPELVFRRSKVWPDLDTVDDRMLTASRILKDLQFTLEYAEKDSRLFMAAKAFDDMVALVKEGPYETDEDILLIIKKVQEKKLRQWSTDASLSDMALRANVLEHLQRSPEALRSFVDYIFLMDDNADVALGYIQPEVQQVALIYEDERWYLMCEYTYTPLSDEDSIIEMKSCF